MEPHEKPFQVKLKSSHWASVFNSRFLHEWGSFVSSRVFESSVFKYTDPTAATKKLEKRERDPHFLQFSHGFEVWPHTLVFMFGAPPRASSPQAGPYLLTAFWGPWTLLSQTWLDTHCLQHLPKPTLFPAVGNCPSFFSSQRGPSLVAHDCLLLTAGHVEKGLWWEDISLNLTWL